MIRVAWRVPNTTNWIGGLNYFRNLLNAMELQPNRQVLPIILGGKDLLPEPLNHLESIPDIYLGSSVNPKAFFSKVERLVFQNGGYFARYLKKNKIRLLSHSDFLGSRSPVPALGWIPDFQHMHLPQFFTRKEILQRRMVHNMMAREMQGIVFSSEHALRDFQRYYPKHRCKIFVLKFSVTNTSESLDTSSSILENYGIREPFFHLPNQFWAHKNHGLVIDAMKILESRGGCPLVVSTGQTHDYRCPGYFEELKEKVKKFKLTDRFRILGLIEYSNVAILLKKSVCIINPSLFEGWSTTVEEAKSLGKRILLSSIPVHHEQNPLRGTFFQPNDPDFLADQMERIFNEYDPKKEEEKSKTAAIGYPEEVNKFAQEYENIVSTMVKIC